ncbi:hypothetical protein J1G43_02930 [Cellulomonas sp. zg-ZUI22]|nr:hypothetical protein [Cellulomonas sp. zg-ZUI22]MBO0898920.1 hypothetical protein [Cellulomonas sp. zg-ZUI22]
MTRLSAAALLGLMFVVMLPAVAHARGVGSEAQGGAIRVTASRTEQMARENVAVAAELRLFNYERAPMCREVAGRWTMGFADGTCPAGADRAGTLRECAEGDTIVMPMWRQSRATPTAAWGSWEQIDEGGCGVDLLPELTAEGFRRLPLPAPALTMQPDRGWVLVNIETITHTDPTPVTLRTELLGYGITVEATPTRWTYDYGDGHTLATTSPGRPYPAHDVFHRYETPGSATITLTAEWTGRYQVDGHPTWRDVDGTATTTASTPPFSVEERTSRLVSGLCTDRPKPPDC